MRHAVMIFATLILVGCSAGAVAPSVSPHTPNSNGLSSTKKSWMSADFKSGLPLLYVSAVTPCDCVLIYRRDRAKLIGAINLTVVPLGITTDSTGTLYVSYTAENGFFGVAEYPPGSTSPSKTLSVPEYPSDVAVGANGTVYVSNRFPVPNVSIYANGSTTPTSKLFDSAAVTGYGISVDVKGNIFWGIQTGSGYQIDRFVHGTTFPIKLHAAISDIPESLNFDKQGRLIVTQPDVPVIDVFVLPGTLVQQFGQQGAPYGAIHDPLHNVWVADFDGSIEEYLSSDGSLRRTFTIPSCCPFDVAVFPLT